MLAPILVLCSVGIALGRVHRFNSWDALSQPDAVFGVVIEGLADPVSAARGVALLVALTCSLGVGYLVLYAVSGLVPSREPRGERRL
jgi:uncharacterized membrane protein